MKKALTVLALLLVLCTSMFATQKATAAIDPFTFQSFVQKDGAVKNSVKSTYGIGIGIGYIRECDKGYLLGADIKFDACFIKNQKSFTDIALLAKAGYIKEVREAISVFGNVEAGLDIQSHNKTTSSVFEFGFELGAQWQFKEDIDLFASLEGLFGFPKKGDVKYSEFRLTPAIGAGYSF